MKKSKVTWSKIDDDAISEVEKLVLDESRIGDRKLFRINNYFNIVLVRRDLAKAIDDAGFEGMRWKEIEDL